MSTTFYLYVHLLLNIFFYVRLDAKYPIRKFVWIYLQKAVCQTWLSIPVLDLLFVKKNACYSYIYIPIFLHIFIYFTNVIFCNLFEN